MISCSVLLKKKLEKYKTQDKNRKMKNVSSRTINFINIARAKLEDVKMHEESGRTYQ